MLYSSYRTKSISNIHRAKFDALFLVQETVYFKYSQCEVCCFLPRTENSLVFLQIFTGRSLMVSSFPAQNTVYSSSPRTHSVSNVHRDKFNGLLLLQNTVLFRSLSRTEYYSFQTFTGCSLKVSYSHRTQSHSLVHRAKFDGLFLV